MKIEQLLVQHFYNHREVTLQGMGTFTLSPDFVLPKENDKDAELPDNAISFQYNARATQDDELISYIVQQTRKMKSLAAADLDSYLVLGKQFLNIGKPFKIEGMGMLVKNQQGELEFTKGGAFHARMETPHAAAAKEKTVNPEISFASESKKTEGGNKKILLVAGAVVLLGLVGTTAWYFLSRKNNTVNDTAANVTTMPQDTAKSTVTKPDTAATKPPVTAIPANYGYTFKVVFLKTSDSAAAVSRMNVLTARHHTVIMYKKDSVTFALAEPFKLPLSDTAHVKDSLNRYYYLGKAVIEIQ